jgi:hypothetical protein
VGRRRKDGNHTPQENNSIEDSVGNEENGYPDPDPNKTMINVTKKPSDAYQKKNTQGGNTGINHRETYGDMLNQNVQDELKKFQDTKNEEYEKTRK